MPRLAEHEMALLRSQSGSYAGMALSVAPASFLTRIDSALFRVLLLRLPLRSCSVCADTIPAKMITEVRGADFIVFESVKQSVTLF